MSQISTVTTVVPREGEILCLNGHYREQHQHFLLLYFLAI